MSEIKTGGPAFPFSDVMPGMSLRDYFAAKAMQSWVLATTDTYIHGGEHQTNTLDTGYIARYAYEQADAMIKAREAK
jgi:hypothetical protein